jgi:hypothetical protein
MIFEVSSKILYHKKIAITEENNGNEIIKRTF